MSEVAPRSATVGPLCGKGLAPTMGPMPTLEVLEASESAFGSPEAFGPSFVAFDHRYMTVCQRQGCKQWHDCTFHIKNPKSRNQRHWYRLRPAPSHESCCLDNGTGLNVLQSRQYRAVMSHHTLQVTILLDNWQWVTTHLVDAFSRAKRHQQCRLVPPNVQCHTEVLSPMFHLGQSILDCLMAVVAEYQIIHVAKYWA